MISVDYDYDDDDDDDDDYDILRLCGGGGRRKMRIMWLFHVVPAVSLFINRLPFCIIIAAAGKCSKHTEVFFLQIIT